MTCSDLQINTVVWTSRRPCFLRTLHGTKNDVTKNAGKKKRPLCKHSGSMYNIGLTIRAAESKVAPTPPSVNKQESGPSPPKGKPRAMSAKRKRDGASALGIVRKSTKESSADKPKYESQPPKELRNTEYKPRTAEASDNVKTGSSPEI